MGSDTETEGGGSIVGSWRQEPCTPACCTELNAAEKGKAPAVRDAVMQKFQNLKPFPSHEEMVALNRSAAVGNLK